MRELIARLFAKPGIATELIAASFFVNVLALASPLFVIQVLNRYVAQGVDATLATLTTGVVIAVALEFGFRQVRVPLARAVSAGRDEDTALAGFTILTQAKTQAIERVPPEMRAQIVGGSAHIEQAYNANNITAVIDVPFAVLFVFVLYLLSPVLALTVAGFLITVFIAGTISAASARRQTRVLTDASNKGSALMGTAIKELDTVRIFNARALLKQMWSGHTRRIQDLRRKLVSKQGMTQSITHSASMLQSVAVIAIGAVLVVKGEMDVGAMIGANILAARALQPISRFSQLGATFARAQQALDLYREFAKVPLEPPTGTAKKEYLGGISLKDVAFAHEGSTTPLFESLTVDIEPGTVVAIVGGNATGKTTLSRLLVGLVEPSRGQVLADGLELRQVAPEWWRKQIIYMPQEPTFLNATLEENLRLANPDIDMDGLNRVITAAGLRKYVDESPKGLETLVADNGRHLSVGTRRRLALARALTTGGMLAVLDEPTEGMDQDGCAAVYAVLNELAKGGRTIIAISHDPKILKAVQMVIDLNFKPMPKVTILPRAVDTAAQAPKAAKEEGVAQ